MLKGVKDPDFNLASDSELVKLARDFLRVRHTEFGAVSAEQIESAENLGGSAVIKLI